MQPAERLLSGECFIVEDIFVLFIFSLFRRLPTWESHCDCPTTVSNSAASQAAAARAGGGGEPAAPGRAARVARRQSGTDARALVVAGDRDTHFSPVARGAASVFMLRNAALLSVGETPRTSGGGWLSPRPSTCPSSTLPAVASPPALAPTSPQASTFRALTPRAKVLHAKLVLGRDSWRDLDKKERVRVAADIGNWMQSMPRSHSDAGRAAREDTTSLPGRTFARTSQFCGADTNSVWNVSWGRDEGGLLTWTESWHPPKPTAQLGPISPAPGTPMLTKVSRNIAKLQDLRPIHLPNRSGRREAMGRK